MILLSNTKKVVVGLDGYGLRIIDQRKIVVPTNGGSANG
jgi:hypothetical protein